MYSFQKSDCEKYGFEFTDKIYSKVDIEKYAVESDQKSDVYFIGLAKDRMEKIYGIFQKLTAAGFTCDFTVIVNKINNYQKMYPGITFKTSRLSYSTILRKIAATKCILEICADGQDGLTMRFYEAVFYNKRLITNNRSAKKSELYNADYMQIIETDDDICLERVIGQEETEYNYQGEFSPSYFIKKLIIEGS